MTYRIELSDEAKADFDDYIDAICYDYGMLSDASRIYAQLSNEINKLSRNPDIYKLETDVWYWKFGLFVRRVNFKSKAIIYTLHDDLVYIHRIASQAEITGGYN